MAIYGYVRVSTAEQAADDRSSLETQAARIRLAAGYSGRAVDEMVEEPGASGAMPFASRPAGGGLFGRMKAGDLLIVAKLDRAFRNAEDALATARQLQERKVDLIIADMGPEPVTQNGASRMFFGMLALVAEFERERIRERLDDGRRAKRASGGHIGGTAPFGYAKVGAGRAARLEPIPAQQQAIQTMRAMKADGASLRTIADAVRERHGFTISHLAVRTALQA